jgi:cytochrome c-type biogenesis protein CcmH/NrfG
MEQPTPVEPAPAVKTEKPKRYKEPPTEAEILLQGARQALAAGDAGRALSDYKKMINRKQELDTVIEDLEEALDRYPNLPTMWQALGDAYMKADRLAEAIQAYQRGMEVA